MLSAMGSSAYTLSSGSKTTDNYAAKVCSDYRGGGYDNWFLPSMEELDYMYHNLYKNNLGGLTEPCYWSSTEYNENYEYYQYFNHESWGQSISNRNADGRIRPVRAF